MSIPLTINGAVFEYPVDFDENWGVDATGWAQAVTNGMLQMAGGSFPLTAEVDFGGSFGLKALYLKSRETNPASAGILRLSSASAGVAWRNNANTSNLVLTTNASDQLLFNGVQVNALATPISIANGGTNSGTALNNNRVMKSSGGSIVENTALSANFLLTADTNGLPTTSPSGTQTIAENLAFSPTTKGIVGTTTNNNAAAGNVGEHIVSAVVDIVAPASAAYGDATNILLSAGDWDVTVVGSWDSNGATWSSTEVGVSSTPGNNGSGLGQGDNYLISNFASTSTTITRVNQTIAAYRVSLASSTTYYLKINTTYSVGSPRFNGRISARRVR